MSKLTAPIKITRNTIGVTASNVVGGPSAPLTTAKSAYRLWLDAGNVGSLDDFFAFLSGEAGPVGPQGEPGPTGATGATTVNNVNVNAAIIADAAATRATLALGSLATQSGNVVDFLTTTAAESIYRPLDEDAYTHAQLSANNSWLVPHNLNRYPSVTITDSAGSVVIGNVTYLSPTQIRLDFSAAFSGTAYLN